MSLSKTLYPLLSTGSIKEDMKLLLGRKSTAQTNKAIAAKF